ENDIRVPLDQFGEGFEEPVQSRDTDIVVDPGLATHLLNNHLSLFRDWNVRRTSRKQADSTSGLFDPVRLQLGKNDARSFKKLNGRFWNSLSADYAEVSINFFTVDYPALPLHYNLH